MRVYAGVDGGGSKTTCAVSDESGRILGRATTGPSNYSALGIDVAAERVAEAIRSALCDAALGAAPPQFAGICLALAGVARPDDHRTWRTALAGLMDGGSVRAQWDTTAEDAVITHDAMAALVGGTGRRQGVVVIAGTGAIAFGVSARGDERRASGWGYLLGDEGSGYWIGLQALRAVCRADDGRDDPTALTAAVLDAKGLTRPQDLVRPMYSDWKPVDVAALAPVVFQVAAAGDITARGIVDQAATELADAACAVLHGLALEHAEVVTSGGLWTGSSHLADLFSDHVRQRCAATVIAPRDEPVAGALLLARGLA